MSASSSRSITLIIALLAFISLGLPDGTLGVAWPSIRVTFSLSLSQLGTLLTASMLGYLLASAVSGRLVEAIGVCTLLTLSTAVMALSIAGYALSPAWWGMIGCAAGAGLGSGAIDAGLNAYAAHHFSARAINWMHATFGFGAATGPLLMTALITSGASWRWGYAVIAVLMSALTVTFLATRRVWNDDDPGSAAAQSEAARVEVAREDAHPLRRLQTWAGIGLFFVYVGLEFSTGQWAFSLLTESRGVSATLAGVAVGLFWASITIGRIILGALTTRVSTETILRAAIGIAPLAAICVWWRGHAVVNILGLMLMGFTLAPIFPLMISLTPQRVGRRDASHVIGYQIAAAALGGAGGPALAGLLAKRYGLEIIGPYIFTTAVILLVLPETVTRSTPARAGVATHAGV